MLHVQIACVRAAGCADGIVRGWTEVGRGGDGIGTGWSCYVPNYNPRDVVRRTAKTEQKKLSDRKME